MRHIPNILTVLRLLATPFILQRILVRDLDTALVVFFLVGLTDTIDGTLARRFQWTSRFGAVLDPIADKLLLTSTFLTLGYMGYMPVWVVAVVIARDLIILTAALILKFTGRLQDFPPSAVGKISTLLQLLTAGSVLLRWPPDPSPFFFSTVAIAVVSLCDYAVKIVSRLRLTSL